MCLSGWELLLSDRLRATALAMQPYCEQVNGIIYYRDPHTEHYQIYVHDGKVGGHFGYLKVLHQLKDRYYCKGSFSRYRTL